MDGGNGGWVGMGGKLSSKDSMGRWGLGLRGGEWEDEWKGMGSRGGEWKNLGWRGRGWRGVSRECRVESDVDGVEGG